MSKIGLRAEPALGLSARTIIASSQTDVKLKAPRSKDMSLINEKAQKIGFSPPSLKKELKKITLK